MAILEKEKILAPKFETIPEYLKRLPQWVLWRAKWDEKRGEYKKPPFQPNGSYASSTDQKTWSTFEDVKAAYENGGFDGIGFAMAPGDNLICIDVDNLEDVYNLPTKFHAIAMSGYSEISPSGNGLHTWLLGKKPDKLGSRTDEIEFYDGSSGRYITITGHNELNGFEDIQENQGAIDYVIKKFFTKKNEPTPPKQKKSPNLQNEGNSFGKLSDNDVVEMIAQRNPKAYKIYQGDFSDYGNDHSRAIAALLPTLAYWTDNDPGQMDRIIRTMYNLNHEKWDRQQNDTTWGQLEIQAAIQRQTKTRKDDISKKSTPSVSNSNPNTQGGNNSTEVLKKPGRPNSPYKDVIKLLEVDKKGKIMSSAFNLEQIFNSRIFHRALGYDMFRQREVIGRDLPWRQRLLPNKTYEQWQSADDAQLRHFLRYYFNISGKELVMDTLTHQFHKNSFHPVKIYIKSVPWDKQPRVETFFIDYLGAEDTPYTRSVARKWFTAAVKRIYEPGCKFDYMPVLVGEQGVGKSTAIQKLAPDFFNDSLRNFDVKESGEILQGSWIIEIGELAAMKKSEEEEMKGFLSRQVDTYRPAYARTAQDFPRHCVFMGTTNNYQFLKDTTGNRRFLPIQVSNNRKYTPWNDLDQMTVAQLWAEAYTIYMTGESIDLEEEIKEAAKIIQAEYTERDEREGIIQDYLEMLLPTTWEDMSIIDRRQFFQDGKQGSVQREFVCVMEVWKECLGEYDNPSRMDSNKIIGILSKLGWKPKAPSRKRFKHYSIQRAYTKQ